MLPCIHCSPPFGLVTVSVGVGGKFSAPGLPPFIKLAAQLAPTLLSRFGSSNESDGPLPSGAVGQGAVSKYH